MEKKMPIVKDEFIKKYLLDALPKTEREQFEEQYFEHDDLYQRMLLIEEELISDYVYDRLPAPERRLFDSHYSATSERRQRIEMARNWKRVIAAPSQRNLTEILKRGFTSLTELINIQPLVARAQTVIVALSIASLMVGAAIAWNHLMLRPQTGGQLASNGADSPDRSNGQERYAAAELALATSLIGTPDYETRSLTIPRGFSGATLSLPTPSDPGSQTLKVCVARLFRGEATGEPVWGERVNDTRPNDQLLQIKVPKKAFAANGLYTLLLIRYPTEAKDPQQAVVTSYRVMVTLE
jgi:hypothetical protein